MKHRKEGFLLNWFRRVMYGRYGTDDLGIFLILAGMLTALVSAVTGWWIVRLLSYFLYIFCLYRMFSKNIYRRQKENAYFLQAVQPVKRWFKLQSKKFGDRKDFRYFTCPKCRQKVRVPKGKGKIRIICPKCKEEFIRKT